MSFTPQIVIDRQDLLNHTDTLHTECHAAGYPDPDTNASAYLLHAMEDDHADLDTMMGRIEITVFRPDLSSLNKSVREKLTELGVAYGTIN